MNCLFQRVGTGERYKLPQRGPGRSSESQSIFRFYLASNSSKADYLVNQFGIMLLAIIYN